MSDARERAIAAVTKNVAWWGRGQQSAAVIDAIIDAAVERAKAEMAEILQPQQGPVDWFESAKGHYHDAERVREQLAEVTAERDAMRHKLTTSEQDRNRLNQRLARARDTFDYVRKQLAEMTEERDALQRVVDAASFGRSTGGAVRCWHRTASQLRASGVYGAADTADDLATALDALEPDDD